VFCDQRVHRGLEAHVMIALVFVLMSLLSFVSVLAQRPWTVVLARRHNPPEVWSTPLFYETNVIMTCGWSLLFAIAAALNALAPVWIVVAYGVVLFFVGRASPRLGLWYSRRRLEAMGLQA
jgi:hypothetical protein